jgi:hypothetical protein
MECAYRASLAENLSATQLGSNVLTNSMLLPQCAISKIRQRISGESRTQRQRESPRADAWGFTAYALMYL